MVFEHNGKTFDSSKGEITLGMMEELEQQGVDFSSISKDGTMKMSQLRVVATVCLRTQDDTVDEGFVKSIPATRLPEVSEFVADFFTRAFPTGGAAS